MMLDIRTFKFKIFIIFLIPAISIVYFTYFYLNLSNANTEAIKYQKQNIILVHKIIDVIHNLQIERGLSVGFIQSKDPKILRQTLIITHKESDKAIADLEKFNYHLNLDLHQIYVTRKKVLQQNISFEEVLNFYTNINNHMINMTKYLLPKFDKNRYDALFLINLELLKESAGLERACVYNDLTSGKLEPICKEKLPFLQQDQTNKIENLHLYANSTSLGRYKKSIDKQEIKELQRFRKLYQQHQLTKEDAQQWFEITTNNIDSYNQVSKEILNHFTKNLNANYDDTLRNLNIAMIFWFISIFSAFYFIYIIHKLFQKHEEDTEDLELSSRALDAYEGIVITDKNTKIIKVNKGFERITGYSAEEAIGEKTSILKSGKNPASLYKAMWGSLDKTGSWSGEVLNKRKDGAIYTQRLSISSIRNKKGETKNYIGHLFDITELRKAQQEALYQASHDSLTELINRKHLLKRMREEINRSKRHGFKNAFLFLDLDNFKYVNDTFGHHIGDKLLQHVATSIQSYIRECDIVARISGDEFAIVLLDIDSSHQDVNAVVTKVTNKILTQLNHEIIIEGNSINIGLSVGVRFFPIDDLDNEDQIIKDADIAMYEAKNSGKNRFVIFQE
ncbi:diguanylate cyclase domain-containing protein [Sulfurimonas marina]|uniref:Diguanylate cyclase n=1 Tax=Sulfurimonas marina TaxID=2590551 RepID=A0A7M1AW44_9BACT|nr:diguanylate cyclase [Sulfurimonas marina]QOP41634.1 diguanylate cyclase [Sulfurimonas marina]